MIVMTPERVKKEYEVEIHEECLDCSTFVNSQAFARYTCYIRAAFGFDNMRYDPCPCFDCLVKVMCQDVCDIRINKWVNQKVTIQPFIRKRSSK